jgi:chemotaxis protein MotB
MAHKKKAHVEEEHENSERWLLTYADLITLLLAVFVVLYSTAEQDTSRFRRAVSAMAQVFNPKELARIGPGQGAGNETEACIALGGDSVMCSQEEYQQMIKSQETLDTVQATLEVEGGDGGKGLSTRMTERGLIISVEEKLLFASGKSDFRPGAHEVLTRLAGHLRKVPNPIQINGHTDNVPINTPQFPSNWHLSSARAIKTAEYLIVNEKMPMDRIHVAGYAETAPAAANTTAEGRAKNRRVEVLLLKGAAKEPEVEKAPAPEPERGER